MRQVARPRAPRADARGETLEVADAAQRGAQRGAQLDPLDGVLDRIRRRPIAPGSSSG
jgi:hypothetical protein